MKTKIGIICAGKRETAPVLTYFNEERCTKTAHLVVHEGKIGGVDAVVTTCGVCKVNAALAAQILIDTYGCGAIINGGTCGGMDSRVEICNIVVTVETVYWDAEVPVLGENMREVSYTLFPSDSTLLNAAECAASKLRRPAGSFDHHIFFGRTVTGELFIDRDKRAEIGEKFQPLAVDMETAAIAHACRVNGIPFIAVRAVTDTEKASGLGNYEENCDLASAVSAKLVREILKELENRLE